MRILEFNIDQQVIKKTPGCDFSKIVAGSVGYLFAKFHFSEEWNECRKVANFISGCIEYPVLLDEYGRCEIPREVLVGESFSVSVTGAKSKDYIISTNNYIVKQEVC